MYFSNRSASIINYKRVGSLNLQTYILISRFNKFNLSIKVETGVSTTESLEKDWKEVEDMTQVPDKIKATSPKIHQPKRIKPEKQNDRKEAFDQPISSLSIGSSKSTNSFYFVMFAFVMTSSMTSHQNLH